MLIKPKTDKELELLNQNIKFLRTVLLSMTQEEFADWLNISRNMVNSYDQGSTTPPWSVVIAIDEKLNLDLNCFIKKIWTLKNLRIFFKTPDETLDYLDSISK